MDTKVMLVIGLVVLIYAALLYFSGRKQRDQYIRWKLISLGAGVFIFLIYFVSKALLN